MSSRERERERERERRLWRHRYHAEIASDHAYDYLDSALTLCHMHMHTRRRVLSLHLLSSARSAWQAKTTNSNSCDRAVAQVKYRSTYPNNLGEGTASTEEISKKGIKLILKSIGNRKGDCAWSCSRGQTQPEKICKLQSTNQYNVRSEWHWFVRCDLQIFSGCVCPLEQLHAQSPFLFPIVFSINIALLRVCLPGTHLL